MGMSQRNICVFILLSFALAVILVPDNVGTDSRISGGFRKNKNLNELCRRNSNSSLCLKACKAGGFAGGSCSDAGDCKCSQSYKNGKPVLMNIFGPDMRIRRGSEGSRRYEKGRGILEIVRPMFFDEDIKTDNVDVDVSFNLTLDMSSLFDMIKTLKAPDGFGFECNSCFCLVGCGMHGYTGGFCAKNMSSSTSCICTYEEDGTT